MYKDLRFIILYFAKCEQIDFGMTFTMILYACIFRESSLSSLITLLKLLTALTHMMAILITPVVDCTHMHPPHSFYLQTNELPP